MKKGFTLIELLVVIAIIATILGMAIPNYLGARERARDTKRKGEMSQLKSALRLYYNDYQVYPANFNGGIGKINYIQGCGASGTGNCPCSATVEFAGGGTGCDITYMKKFPTELGSSMYYYRISSGDDFCLKVPLDNASDGDIAASQSRCAGACAGLYSASDYVTCSD
jgi:general secretion pathway protein G